MRIGVNAFPLRAEGGGARFVFGGLLSSLLKIDREHHYLIFAHLEALRLVHEILNSQVDTLSRAGPDPRVKVIHIADEGQIYGHRFDFDLLFGPLNNLQPRLYDRPTVAILHDIQEQYFPQYFSESDLLGRKEVYPEICRSATTLVAISDFCKQSFVEKFGIDPAKIEVVPNAPQADLINVPGDGHWSLPPLPARYLFYPANCYAHKNHKLLLDLAERLKARGDGAPGAEVSIIFSGYELPGGFPLRQEIARRGLGDVCRVFTNLPAQELRYLYRHAQAMVMPTKFEGFGMPAIESAACGCPVVCSDLPALREVLGDNALYFNPDCIDDLERQVARILADAPLREGLIENGLTIAGRYTWDDSARRMLTIFGKARERFVWGRHAPHAVRRPRIGVMVRMPYAGAHVVRTIESLLCTGYPDLALRCEAPADLPAPARQFLKSAGVEIIEPQEPDGSSHDRYEDLRQFAMEQHLDILGQVIEGNRFKPSALDSVAWSFLEAPEAALYLGESMDWRGEAFVGTARLRITGAGLWKFEGYLYPELLFFNHKAMEAWPQGTGRALEGGTEWRWELLRAARAEGRLFLSRRTLADTDQLIVGPRSMLNNGHAARYANTHRAKMMRRLERPIKRAARLLPIRVQRVGTNFWYLLGK